MIICTDLNLKKYETKIAEMLPTNTTKLSFEYLHKLE